MRERLRVSPLPVMPDPLCLLSPPPLLSSPTPIGDPGSWFFYAGFRPHTTRFLREACSLRFLRLRFLRLRFLRLRSGQAGQAGQAQDRLRTGLLFRQKDPKPVAPGRGPQEKPKVVILNAVKNLFFVDSRSLIESSFATLPSASLPSASLRQSSPPKWNVRDRGTATPAGAGTTTKNNDSGSSRTQG